MIKNILLEAQLEIQNINNVIKGIKDKLNKCELSKFKNAELNRAFYNSFFCSTVEDGLELSFTDWSNIYRELITDLGFLKKLGYFMSAYYVNNDPKIFANYISKFIIQYRAEEKTPLILLNMANNTATTISNNIIAMIDTMVSQLNYAPNLIQYKVHILSTFNTFVNDNIKLHNKYIEDNENINENIELIIDDPQELEELENLIELKKNLQNINESTFINEGVSDAANDAKVSLRKFEEMIDNRINRRVKAMRDNRRRRKHQQMVEESLAVSNEIKRILKFLPVALINAGLAALGYIVSIIIDKKTDKKDKAVLLGDLKLEEKIIDEKISIAERKGHDKEKIELMRAKDKIQREHERILKA